MLLLVLTSPRRSCRVKCSCKLRGNDRPRHFLLYASSLAGTLRHTHPTPLPFQVSDEQTEHKVVVTDPMSHSWLFLGCHTYRHVSPLLTEELPDVIEGCQGTLPSGEKTQSEPSIRPLTLPRTGKGTALRPPPLSTLSTWLSSAVFLGVRFSERYFPWSSYRGPAATLPRS